ncbi:MAG: hypothetical protein KAR42_06795 [candidate division Zixibacteria bacterium]|nr:hypothetical protein [candidate division Zixibacteria bacterium]
MKNSRSKDSLRYKALADVVLSATEGMVIDLVARKGLAAAIEYLDLASGALILWDNDRNVITKSVEAPKAADREILMETEDSILLTLRNDYKLGAAYFELGGEETKSVFSLPVEIGGLQFGAIIGIKYGRARLYESDEFLRSLASALALASGRKSEGATEEEMKKKIDEERNAAQVEIAVAVNHYINNPLTALMGNLQLLSLKHQELPEDILRRLTVIEESARQISEVTKRLMSVSDADSTEYINGTKMTNFFGDEKDSNSDNDIDEDKDSSHPDGDNEEI